MGKKFLVSYDIHQGTRKDYEQLWAALRALGGQPVLLSQWLVYVKAGTTAMQILKHLMQYIDSNDRLLVNDYVDWASVNTKDLNKAA